MNPQIRFGEDLMSRVSYSMMNPDGAEQMTRAVREAMNTLFSEITTEAQIDKSQIMDSVFVCNPVMHHLFLGIDPYELGQAPFALATSNALSLKAAELGLDLHPEARTYILPCIAGHVGADAAAVTLSETPNCLTIWCCWSMSAPMPRSCSATGTASSPPVRRPGRPSKGREILVGPARRAGRD
jgi:Uncharacterized metal-binding protein